jgi:hypothetical protein
MHNIVHEHLVTSVFMPILLHFFNISSAVLVCTHNVTNTNFDVRSTPISCALTPISLMRDAHFRGLIEPIFRPSNRLK